MSQTTKILTYAIIGLVIGAGAGWLIYPAVNPPVSLSSYVAKSTYDALKAQSDADKATLAAAQSDLAAAQAQIAELTAPKKIGLILATGGLGDKSFNDISYAGVQKAKEDLGILFDYVEPKAIAEYEGYQRDFAMSGDYVLIICVGFDQADALAKIADEYPNQNFAIVDMVVDKPNVASLTFRANEASFLVGVVAGAMTETGKVGFVGGMDIPLIKDFFVGYEAGAEWANPSVTVSTPVFVGDWGDPGKGKELAISLIEGGDDVIYAAAGKSGLGALEATHDEGVTGIGVDSCQCYLYPEIIASATKRVDKAVYQMILNAIVGKFNGGFYSGGLKEGWVGMCRLPDEESLWEEVFNFQHSPLPADVLSKVKEARDLIIAGDIVVPSGYG
jgi:basic membrane protein A